MLFKLIDGRLMASVGWSRDKRPAKILGSTSTASVSKHGVYWVRIVLN